MSPSLCTGLLNYLETMPLSPVINPPNVCVNPVTIASPTDQARNGRPADPPPPATSRVSAQEVAAVDEARERPVVTWL